MVKSIQLMNTANSQVLPAPPSLMKALMAGFDAITNHIEIILFPIALDLILWLGPHLRLTHLVRGFFNQAAALPEMSTAEMAEVVRNTREIWLALMERFNLLSALRAFPVGIPSLMVSRSPLANPGGTPLLWEIPSFAVASGLWILLLLVGLAAGSLYFSVVAQAALDGRMDWRRAVAQWPLASLQVLFLTLLLVALLIAASIPFSCVLSLFFLSGMSLGRFATLLFGGLLVWLLLPLFFSPHGIFVHRYRMWDSLRVGVRITRLTLPSTGLLILIIVILSEGLDVLWRIPAETSWLAFVGVAGHAFVTTGLLAASFVYYRDAGHWVQKMSQQVKLTQNRHS